MNKETISNAFLAIVAVCAVIVTGAVLRREMSPTSQTIRSIRDWRPYTEAGQRIGPPSAQVVILEFGDYQCPACKYFHQVVVDVMESDPDLALVLRHMPLARHQHALQAAIGAQCAAAQSRFSEWTTVLFEAQDSLGLLEWPTLAARARVPNVPAFQECIAADEQARAQVNADIEAARLLGVNATPTIFVNGQYVSGVPGHDALRNIVREARSRL